MKSSANGKIEARFVKIDEIQIGDRDPFDSAKAEELAESIGQIGLMNPITLNRDYQLIAGLHRLQAYRILGHATIPALIVDLDTLDAELAEIDENLIRKDFTILQRAEMLHRRKEIYEAKYPIQDRKRKVSNDVEDPPPPMLEGFEIPPSAPSFFEDIATKLGVDPRTIYRDVQIADDIPKDVRDIIRHTPIADNKRELLDLSRRRPEEQLEIARGLASDQPQLVKQARDRLAPMMSSASPEWYTPKLIIERVIKLMGAIDLDPCSNSHDNPNVPAQNHFTEEDDGLTKEWHGRIYMNPPYGRVIDEWVEKLCKEHESGHVKQAIALVPSRTDTAWFRRLRMYPRCFVSGRLNFSGYDNSAPFPSMIVALGCDVGHFASVFGNIGDIYELVTPNGDDQRLF